MPGYEGSIQAWLRAVTLDVWYFNDAAGAIGVIRLIYEAAMLS